MWFFGVHVRQGPGARGHSLAIDIRTNKQHAQHSNCLFAQGWQNYHDSSVLPNIPTLSFFLSSWGGRLTGPADLSNGS